MKKLIYFIFLFTGLLTYSQEPFPELEEEPCATDQLMNALISANPEIRERLDLMDQELSNLNSAARTSNLPLITIPVVVYVVHDNQPLGIGSNISDNQVNTQLGALNTYFESYGIQFCLATKDRTLSLNSYGPLTSVQNTLGIIHINNSAVSNHDTQINNVQALVNTANSNITSEKFLKIWVVKSINGTQSGIKGYSVLPNMSSFFDGIVMSYDVFGNGSANLLPNYNQGKSLVHEVGHYLGLYHTFNEGCLGMDQLTCSLKGDRVCDTPPTANQNFICFAGNSCNETFPSDLPDAVHNYMDYGNNSCTIEFSPGQKQRMLDVLTIYRSTLFSDDNLINAGVCGATQLLSASFVPNTYMPCQVNSVAFAPISTGSGISYSWNFGDTVSGANNTSVLSNPSHVFSSASTIPYIVTLTITNGTITTFSTAQIFVTGCSSIQNSEVNWCFGSNGLNFSSGVPVNSPIPLANTLSENSAVQSNASGSLLFYTNGVRVWDGIHDLIGSNPLFGNTSSRNGTVIVPNPGNSNQYFVFTKSPMEAETNGFRYSIVNVTGTTVAVPGLTINKPVTTPSGYLTGNNGALLGGEGIAAVERHNGLGYWIITTAKKSTGQFMLVYSLNSSGILTYVSSFDLGFPSITSTGLISSVEISPNGNKIAFIQRNSIFLIDFNKYNGTLSNKLTIDSLANFDGGSFSPNSNLLYTQDSLGRLCQYNVNSSNPVGSKIVLSNNSSIKAFQKGPDNKVYFSYNPTYSSSVFKLGVIHQPDNICSQADINACFFTLDGPIVDRPANVSSLPNMIDAKDATAYNNTISSYPTNCTTYKFFPNAPGASFNWNFGDPNSGANNTSPVTIPTHIFSADGTYIVTLRSATNVIIATTIVTVGMTIPEILGSSQACTTTNNVTNNSVVLQPGQTVTWSIAGGVGTIASMNNQSDVTINWTSLPGIVSLTVTNAAGCTTVVNKVISDDCACDCLSSIGFSVLPQLDNTWKYTVYNDSSNPICSGVNIRFSWAFVNGPTSVMTLTSPYPKTFLFDYYSAILTCSLLDSNNNMLCSSVVHPQGTGEGRQNGQIDSNSFNVYPKLLHYNNEEMIKVYPNPSKGKMNIHIAQFTGKIDLQVVDINGRVVYNVQNDNFNIDKTIDLSHLQSGIYILKINGEELNHTQKIILN